MDTEEYVNILANQIENLDKKIDTLFSELSEVKQVLNNGIKSETKGNTEAIEELSQKVEDIKNEVDTSNSFDAGKLKAWQILLGALVIMGNFIVGLVTLLHTLGLF